MVATVRCESFGCALTRSDEGDEATLEVRNYDSNSFYTGSVGLPMPAYLFDLPAVYHLASLDPDSYLSGLFQGAQVLVSEPKRHIRKKI